MSTDIAQYNCILLFYYRKNCFIIHKWKCQMYGIYQQAWDDKVMPHFLNRAPTHSVLVGILICHKWMLF